MEAKIKQNIHEKYLKFYILYEELLITFGSFLYLCI